MRYIPGWGTWIALEGSHRIMAAKELGLVPKIIEVEYSDKKLSDLGLDQGDMGLTVEEVCDSAYDRPIIEFQES